MFEKAVRRRAIAAFLWAVLAFAGCAEERGRVGRVGRVDPVPPDALDKSFFLGADFDDPADDPEFYSQATLVEVGNGAAQGSLFTSTTQQLARIKWAITEDLLIGRVVQDLAGNISGKAGDEVIAAMFRISKHYDVARTYDPSAGEEEERYDRPWNERRYIRVDWSKNLNTDSFDFGALSLLGIPDSFEYQPFSYYVDDPADRDAPHFDQGYFDVTVKVLAEPRIVDLRRFGWEIDEIPACAFGAYLPGGASPSTGCDPVELTIRHSFRKVTDTDYEPLETNGYEFRAFGAFFTERTTSDPRDSETDRVHRLVNRFNIWERSHSYADPAEMTGAVECFTPATTPAGDDPNRDEDGDGTADECATVGRGSRCDTFSRKCTLPYRDREIRPQPLYFTNGSNLEYFDATDGATREWDTALRMAVMSARYAECTSTRKAGDPDCAKEYPVYFGQQEESDDAIRLSAEVDACLRGKAWPEYAGRCGDLADTLGADRGYSAGVIAVAKMDRILVLCHSPVQADDPAACGGPRLPGGLTAEGCADAEAKGDLETLARCGQALTARIGDLRFHQVNVIKTPQSPSPWAVMADAHDPLTGEKVAASINVWSHVSDRISQDLVDMARYAEKELTTKEVTEATFVHDWSRVAELAGKGAGVLAPMTADVLDEKLASLTGVSPEALRAADMWKFPASVQRTMRDTARELRAVRAEFGAPSSNRPLYEARRRAATGTALEAELTTRAMQQYAGLMPADLAAGPAAVVAMASPFQGANPSLARELRDARWNALAERGACVLDGESPAPGSIAILARHLQRKFGDFDPSEPKAKQLERAEKMRRYVASRIHQSVISHEMGHSVGLQHNFVGSSDAWGYRPQYWQLRTRDGARDVPCTGLNEPAGCIGPRYFDPVSEEQGDQLIQMFMHSSVMDHAGELTQNMMGLGAYDFAAARFLYGKVVSVFHDASFEVGTPRAAGMLDKIDDMGGSAGIKPSIPTKDGEPNEPIPFHYSQVQQVFEVIRDCHSVDPIAFRPTVWNAERDGQWDPLLDGQIVSVGGTHTRCRQQPVDYVRWSSLRMPGEAEIRGYRGGPAVDELGRVRVPFGFAADRWADVGNPSVLRHDSGADTYELFDFLITQQEMNHIFADYRRDRLDFYVRKAVNHNLARYDEKLRDATKGLGLQLASFRDLAGNAGEDPNELWAAAVKTFGWKENLLAAGFAFDHFSRQLARPQAGNHEFVTLGDETVDPVLRSADTRTLRTAVTIPNGATVPSGNVGFGGRPVNNILAIERGAIDLEYIQNVGSYYEKAWTAMLMTESVDNLVGDTRLEPADARYSAVSLADLFPEGYRRWLANNLTGDDELKGARLVDEGGRTVARDEEGYPTKGIRWTSWWPEGGPQGCYTEGSRLACSTNVADTVALDPEVGREQQKFLIAWTLLYLPENRKQAWLDQMRLWQLGSDSDPGFPNRIEFHDPHGVVYVAKTFGKETIFGKRVQKGVAARVLEWANELTRDAFVTTDGLDLDGDGAPDWYEPVFVDGQPLVKFDPTMIWIGDDRGGAPAPAGCNSNDDSKCTCEMNRACLKLRDYAEVPFFLSQALATYGVGDPSMKSAD